MILSLNEIEGTVSKAARGAGLSWGLAEEAAVTARWLAGRGVDFGIALLEVLETRPALVEHCPFAIGAMISDRAKLPTPYELGGVYSPVLLLPFLARIARPGAGVIVGFGQHELCLTPKGLHGSVQALAALAAFANADGMAIRVSDAAPAPDASHWPLRHDGCRLSAEMWTRMNALAARTYVPASMQSRISGAGAGALDND